MRNITYGFEHIDHRFRTLTHLEPPTISVEQRINLNDMLSQRFGSGYANDPKMLDLMTMNGGRHRHFLTGPEEVQAFAQGEFIRMHLSTLSKVVFFQRVIRKVIEGRLVTRSWGFLTFIDRLFDSRLARAIGFAASGVTILGIVYAITSYWLGDIIWAWWHNWARLTHGVASRWRCYGGRARRRQAEDFRRVPSRWGIDPARHTLQRAPGPT